MSYPQQSSVTETERYAKAVHTAALVAVVACPILALLPPRKLDFYTLGLAGTTAYSGSYLLRASTGRSVWQHLGGVPATDATPSPRQSSVIGDMQRQARGGDGSDSSREAWKMQREREIKQDVEEGKGFQDMIVDQIWEVWNWGKKQEKHDDEQE